MALVTLPGALLEALRAPLSRVSEYRWGYWHCSQHGTSLSMPQPCFKFCPPLCHLFMALRNTWW